MRTFAHLIAFLILATHARGSEPAPDWVRVAEHAAWQARDSQAEVVFNDRLWILGGWFDSFKPAPRDVWSTADGANWQQVTPEAPWKHSDLGMAANFAGRMWFLGGWYNGRLPGHEASSEAWSSGDGSQWRLDTAKPGWTPRLAAACVVFKDKLWLLGGVEDYYFGDRHSLKNDVWSTADGANWQLETDHAAWPARAYHQAAVLEGKIYLFGGGNYQPEYEARNDVWSSSDGVHWDQVTKQAGWSARLWFSSVVYRERMWVLGGWSNNPSRNLGDVWYSRDGKDWQQLVSRVIWKERHEHSAFVWRDKMWVAGGHAQPLVNDVWSLDIPPTWFDGQE